MSFWNKPIKSRWALAIAWLFTLSVCLPLTIVIQGPTLHPAAGGAASCPADGAPDITAATLSNDDENRVSYTSDRIYIGQKDFSHALGTTKSVCKVGFYFGSVDGTVSGLGYRASIWTVSGNNLGSQVTNGISDEITGITTTGWKRFSWSGAKPQLVSGTSYDIVVAAYNAGTTTLATDSTTNFVRVWADNPSSITGDTGTWSNVGVLDGESATFDTNIEIYWYD